MKPAAPIEWSEAVRKEDSAERERFLESHVDLVRYVSLRVAGRLPSAVEVDDLVHDGILGLLDAVQKYDPGRGVRFRTYAERRVRGAILDGLRQRDWQPRAVRRNQRQVDEAMVRVAALRGRGASEEELAEEMGLEVSELQRVLRDTNAGPILPLDKLPPRSHPVVTSHSGRPHAALERKQLFEALADEIGRLPERERYVLALYYHEGLNMKEVGAVLGVTESRVCQLHAQAASRLRSALEEKLHVAGVRVTAGVER